MQDFVLNYPVNVISILEDYFFLTNWQTDLTLLALINLQILYAGGTVG